MERPGPAVGEISYPVRDFQVPTDRMPAATLLIVDHGPLLRIEKFGLQIA
jgi:hypothetical protein